MRHFTGIIIAFRTVLKVILEEIIEQKGGLGAKLQGGGRNNPKSTRQSRMSGLKGSTMNTQSSNPQQGSSSSNPGRSPTQSSNRGSRSSRPQSSNLSQGSSSTLPQSSNQPQNPRPFQLPRQAGSSVPPQETLDINFLFPNHQELRSSIMNKLNSRYTIPSRRLRGLNIGHSSEYVGGFGHFTDEEKRFLVALSVKATPVIHTEGLLRGLRLAIMTTEAKMGCGIHNIRVDRVDRLRVSDLVRVKKYQDGTLSWVSISNSKEDIEQFLRDARI